MRRLSPRSRSRRSLLRPRDTVVDTIIDGPRLRLPPPAAVVALVLGLGLAAMVDRALAWSGSPDVATDAVAGDAATEAPQRHRTMQVKAGEPAIIAPAPRRLGVARTGDGGKLVAQLGDAVAVLARDVDLEGSLERFLVAGRTPYAATVLIEIGTGRVLAVAEHSTEGDANGLAYAPLAPAASVFKVVTTSALLRAGVAPKAAVCMHGGKTRMQPALLLDNPKKDRACTTLGDALALSQNVAIAKLALKHLEPQRLRDEAVRFGFDQPLLADVALDAPPSPTQIPDDPFGFANAAAGFGDVKISALHGAVLAATIAQDGVWIPPRFVDGVEGDADDAPGAVDPHRVLDSDDAQQIAHMMADTVTRGTARRAFNERPRLTQSAAGKTGSLADYSSGLETTWFVGYAPADHPRVAVASVVVNTNKWHVRAPTVAKEALRAYFKAERDANKSRPTVDAVVAAR